MVNYVCHLSALNTHLVLEYPANYINKPHYAYGILLMSIISFLKYGLLHLIHIHILYYQLMLLGTLPI